MWVKISTKFSIKVLYLTNRLKKIDHNKNEMIRKKHVLHLITSLFRPKTKYKIQTFTYYIPSPPPRTSGYREKQFDKLFYEFINLGYTIVDFKTLASMGANQSGMWLVFILQAQNAKADNVDLNDLLSDSLKSHAGGKENIEGFYYIDDRAQNND